MADSKVSELSAATSASAADLLYLVQSSTSKKITVANFCKSLSNVTISGNLSMSGVQTIAAAGQINLESIITHLVGDTVGGVLTIPAGNSNQLKYVAYVSGTGTYTIYSNTAGNAQISFNNAGDAATLLYTNSKWFMVGGSANITYP